MGYPGSKNHFSIDAKTFAKWDVDYLKVDGCFVGENYLNEGDVCNSILNLPKHYSILVSFYLEKLIRYI